MTPLESARLRLPDRSDDALHDLLWSVTCFPFGKPRRWLGQLVAFDYWKKQGLSICMACGNPYKHESGKIWSDQCCEPCEDELRKE